MSWLSKQLHDIEKHVIRPVVHSDIVRGAAIAAGAIVAAPLIVPALGVVASTAGTVAGGAVSTAGALASGAVKAGTAVIGGITKALPTLTEVLGSAGGVIEKAGEIFGKKPEEAPPATPPPATPPPVAPPAAAQRPVMPTITDQSIIDQLADLWAGLTGVPPEATPPFVPTGTIGVQAPTNWALLGLLGIGGYLLLKGR